MYSDDEFDAALALITDPDYILDTLRDRLHEDPVPCAICGGEGAFHIVLLASDAIFFGPRSRDVMARGICAPCRDARSMRIRLTNRGAA